MEEPYRPQISRITWVAISLLVIVTVASAFYYTYLMAYEHGLAETYVGPHACAKCHPRQAESWSKTQMAQSFDALRPGERVAEKKLAGLDPAADYTHDAKCLPCHTTGYGRVGGFVSIELTPQMAGITCEACHGAGGRYAQTVMERDEKFKLSAAREAGLVYPPTAQVCLGCHNENSPFAKIKVTYDPNKSERQGTHTHFRLRYEHGQ